MVRLVNPCVPVDTALLFGVPETSVLHLKHTHTKKKQQRALSAQWEKNLFKYFYKSIPKILIFSTLNNIII